MKVVILCGGQGTRLKEETEYKPKPLVQVGDMPILWHIMKIYSNYGYKEFILCLGYKGQMIKEFFMNYEWVNNDMTLDLKKGREWITHVRYEIPDWKITFVDTGSNSMTGSRIAQIKDYLDEDEDFFLTYGDGLSDQNIGELLKFHKKSGKIGTLTMISPPSRFGVLKYDDENRVYSFREKPRLDGFINGGFCVFNKKIFKYISKDPSCVFEQQPLKSLAKDGELMGFKHQGFWFAMDTYKDYLDINDMCAEGNTPWFKDGKNK